ncbi:MAG: hypothetical protein JWN70_6594 [Planctomycetaceae bacterium]|nr:hypothetical protein [Planctomycetaceae bacterium]
MPFTPFHFGPGFLVKGCAPRQFWLTSFVLANVLIDLEVLYYMHRGEPPLHRYLHTYVGGVAMSVVAALVMFLVARFVLARLPDDSTWLRGLRATPARRMWTQSLVAGLLGGVSHILLDSCMHYDMHPFWPFASGNALAGIVSVGALHVALAITGFFGIIIWLLFPEG